MPAPMFVPPWLQQSADPASQYARGTQLGLAEAAAQAQMAEFAQRQQLAQQELQMEQQKLGMMAEENKQKHLEAQQALAIDKTYRDMQLTVQKRQLDMAGQLMQQRTKQMADQFAAEEQFKNSYAEIKAANPDLTDEQVFSKALFQNPLNLGRLPQGILGFAQRMAPMPQSLQGVPIMGPEGKPIPGMVGVPGASGRLVPRDIPGFNKPGSVGQANLLYARGYQKQLESVNEQLDRFPYTDEDPPKDPIILKRWNKLKKQRDDLIKKIHQLVPEPGTAAAPTGSDWQEIGGFRVRAMPQNIPSYPDQEEEQ